MRRPIEIANRVANLISESEDRHHVLMEVCKYLARSLKSDITSIYITEKENYRLIANKGFDEKYVGNLEIEKGAGLIHHVAKTKRTLCLREATSHASFYYVKGLGEEKYHGFVGVPILRRGTAIGILVIQFRKEHDSSLDEVALLETIAQQISDVVHSTLKRKSRPRKDKTHTYGRGVVPGIFEGKIIRDLLVEESLHTTGHREGRGYEIEKKRLDLARKTTLDFFADLKNQTTSPEAQAILSSHSTMLSDPLLLKKEEQYLKKDYSAEQAVGLAVKEIAEAFENISDPYIRQRSVDVLDIGKRLYHTLSQPESESVNFQEPSVYLANRPSATALIEGGPKQFGALVLIDESLYSHVIILARSMGIPTVILTGDQLSPLGEAERLLVDGERGAILIDPSEVLKDNYLKSHSFDPEPPEDLGPCNTQDGELISLGINAAFVREVENIAPWVEEVGLFRTEFQYFLSPKILKEEQITQNYIEIFRAVENKPVTLRILDVGGDKCPPSLHFMHENNPILGGRSIRFLLKRSDLFFSQLRAMMRAQIETSGQLRILIPMVSVYEEVSRIRDHLAKVIRDLKKEGLRCSVPPLGVMIEVPACIQLLPKLSRLVDFFCIGTNDLLQYYMASDRTNHSVNYLYRWHHPAFLIILEQIAKLCHSMNRRVTICGEMAGELWGSLVLVGLGYHNLSMDQRVLARHHELLSSCNTNELQKLIKKLIDCETSLEILELLQLFLDNWKSLNEETRDILQTDLSKMLTS